jgi:hypothetical protein
VWESFIDRAMTDEIAAAVRSHRTTNKPSEKGTATVKLTSTTNVSVDGVMQGLGGPDEDLLLALHCDGVSVQVYRPTGRPRYAMATAD